MLKVIIKKITKHFRIFSFFIDILILNCAYLVAFKIAGNHYYSLDSLPKDLIRFIFYSNIIWVLLVRIFSPYSIVRFESADKILSRTIKSVITFMIILFLDVIIFPSIEISRYYIVVYFIVFSGVLTIFRTLSVKYLKTLRRRGVNNRRIVILGVNNNSILLAKTFEKELTYGYKLLGFFSDKYESYENITILGKTNQLMSYCKANTVDEIYFSENSLRSINIKDILHFCDSNFIRFKIIPDFQQYTLNMRFNIDLYKDIPILHLRKEPLENQTNKLFKRLFDIAFSLTVIILICQWLFPIIIILQKLFSKGPVFFIQERTGQDNKVFRCYKFRTMYINDQSNSVGTIVNDPRIMPFGKFLRKTKIDELPQFFNVLVGQMSVVGPRPHMVKHTEEYSKLIDQFLVRHFVKPGITGWAQTTGYVDESKKLQEMIDKVKKDVWYIENWSLLLDLKIIFLTIYNIFKADKNEREVN